MSQYAYVQDGAVQTIYNSLPGQYGSITNFNTLTDAEVLVYGFYPYTFTAPSYDALTQELGSTVYTIGSTTVTGTLAVVALSSDQIAANMLAYAQSLQLLCIAGLYGTDWANLSDSGLTTDEATAYTTLRANVNTANTNMTTYTEDQLNSLNTAFTPAASQDLISRLPAFSSNMTTLQTALTALVGG